MKFYLVVVEKPGKKPRVVCSVTDEEATAIALRSVKETPLKPPSKGR